MYGILTPLNAFSEFANKTYPEPTPYREPFIGIYGRRIPIEHKRSSIWASIASALN
jgi:hypothetical protein